MPSTLDDYEVLEIIGTGSYGTCKKIRRKKDGKILVWKELDYGTMTETEKQLLVSEVNLLRELRHQHIVRYYDRIIDRSTTTLFIIMEYCEGGDVASLISQLKKEGSHVDESTVWRICIQVVQALKECHSLTRSGKKVLHRDLKPANVFLDKNLNVKLGDFGLARVLNHECSFAKTYVGTPYYMSPEQMNYKSYNEKSDIWSLGCLLYELCALRPPFTAAGLRELTSKINMGRFARIPFRYSEDLNTFIGSLLQVEEHKRPTVEDVEHHPSLASRYDVVLSTPKSSRPSTPLERATSASSTDEGYASKMDSLTRREEALAEKEEFSKQREKLLRHREKKLEERERSVLLREKLLDERLSSRPENIQKEDVKVGHVRSKALVTGVRQSLDESTLLSCLRSSLSSKDQSQGPGSSYKKSVSFTLEKENDLYSMELPSSDTYRHNSKPLKTYGGLERKVQVDEYTRNVMNIQHRLKQARRRSTEFKSSPDLSTRLMGYR